MENSYMLLLAELPGLEVAKRAIEARIEEIRNILTSDGGELISPRVPSIIDPTILGRDVLGRIKRKRHLSPEVQENRRKLIAAARMKKLQKAVEARGETLPAPTVPTPTPITAAPPGKRKKD